MTNIEWCDESWNPIIGCARVSEGCRHCYAERFAGRMAAPGKPYAGLVEEHGREWRWTNEVRFVEKHLRAPLRWQKPRRVFVNSMGDLFHEKVELRWLDRVFAVMARCPKHVFIVLTKRPERARNYISGRATAARVGFACRVLRLPGSTRDELGVPWPLSNVWLGVSVEDQATAEERLPILLATPSAKHIVSVEPLLGPVDLSAVRWGLANAQTCLDWVIVGGESGRSGARPMHPDWARSIRDQCAASGVPFFFKQWGRWRPTALRDIPADGYWSLLHRDGRLDTPGPRAPDDAHGEVAVVLCAKHERTLDGQRHEAWPE